MARNRIGYALFSGVKAAFSSFAKTLYVLWLQTTGLMFGAFTAVGVMHVGRVYRTQGLNGDPQALDFPGIHRCLFLPDRVVVLESQEKARQVKTLPELPRLPKLP